MRTLISATTVSGLLLAGFMVGAAPSSAAPSESTRVLALINEQRSRVGCASAFDDDRLTAAAARHANDMAIQGVSGHTGSDGSTPASRLGATGYAPVALSNEIVFWGTGGMANPESAIDMWMNSPVHQAVIADCRMVDIGVRTATANGRLTAVAVFATH